jgi:hypothetical protein
MTQEPTASSTIDRLQSRMESLRADAEFTDPRNRMADIDALITGLGLEISHLRSRGFNYRATFEEQSADLARRWPPARRQAQTAMQLHSITLRGEAERVAGSVSRLQSLRSRPLSTAQPTIDRVSTELDAAERRVKTVQDTIESAYAPLGNQARDLEREIKRCKEAMDWLDGATFTLTAGEELVSATEARLMEGKEGTEGILFLTDQRMLFESREKRATKKFLFITTASELVKALRWEAPLHALEGVEASESRKLLSKREMLTVTPATGAPGAEFRLDTDSDGWRALVQRCRTGEIASDRCGAAAVVPEYIVPAKCPTCGGSQSRAGRIRGTAAIPCEFCGSSIALQRAETACVLTPPATQEARRTRVRRASSVITHRGPGPLVRRSSLCRRHVPAIGDGQHGRVHVE